MDERQLSQPSQLFELMFEIHGLAPVIRNDQPRFEAARSRIPKLKTEIMKNFKDTFTPTRRPHNGSHHDETGSERSRKDPGSQGGGGHQHGEHIYDICEVAEAFAGAGYTLESNGEDENGWAPLNQVEMIARKRGKDDDTFETEQTTTSSSDVIFLVCTKAMKASRHQNFI
jgi:hypothetical protein